MVDNLPFKELPGESNSLLEIVTRVFKSDIDSDELKWHWDDEDRNIIVVGETNWKFQFDNELPINMNTKIKVPKGTWHRLIKGDGDLTLIVEKSIYYEDQS
jgi:hypothetical protein